MIVEGRPKISIDLRKGVYFLDPLPSTGKSYLAEELASRVVDDSSIYVEMYKNGSHIDFGDKNRATILIFDRLDMYFNSKIAKFIVEKSRDAIVLLDLKDMNLMVRYLKDTYADIADVEFDDQEIRVGDL